MKGKWLTGALVLAMAAVTLAGCGAKDETKEKVEQGQKRTVSQACSRKVDSSTR